MQPETKPPFVDREDAGRKLASRLARFVNPPHTVVLALPKGGVPVGREIAATLGLPFDILLIARITRPDSARQTLGALTGGGVRMLNFELIDRLHLSEAELRAAILHESRRITRRERVYRGNRPSLEVADQTVIIADDGTSSCETLRTAVRLLRRQHAERVVVATPYACRHTACDLRLEADDVVTLAEPERQASAAAWFRHFPQPSVTEVRHLVREFG